MRNLKRVLALAMALVMILGMMVIGSSAASYTDAAAIDADYAEAVEILSGMGIFEGTGAGFAPKQILDRASAAALVYRVITGDVKNEQTDLYDFSSFADVAEGVWYTPYITYAANNGYIKGYNGNAMPNDTVTGIQVLAMMLRAAGYGQNGEFEGAAWKDGILTKANDLGITKGISTNDLDKGASRELVAQLIFNAITSVDMVSYNMLLGYTKINNGTFMKPEYQTLAQKVFGLNKTVGVVDAISYQTGVTVLGGKTVVNTDADFRNIGYKAAVWTVKTPGAKTLTAVSDVKVLGKSLAVSTDGTAFGVLTGTTPKAVAKLDSDCVYYVNGVLQDTAAKVAAAKTLASQVGVKVDFVDNDFGGLVEAVIITDYTVATVTGIANTTNTGYQAVTKDAYYFNYTTEVESKYLVSDDELAVGDLVVYVKYNTEYYTDEAGFATGKLEQIDYDVVGGADVSYTIGGVEYVEAYDAANNTDLSARNLNQALDVYTDPYGYILVAELSKSDINYLYVLANDHTVGTTGLTNVKVVYSDGTVGTIPNVDCGEVGVNDISNHIYIYETNRAGDFELTLVHGLGYSFHGTADYVTKTATWGNLGVNLETKVIDLRTNYFGNIYTGYAEIPSLTDAQICALVDANGYITLAYLISGTNTEDLTAEFIVFDTGYNYTNKVGPTQYYYLDVIVDGVVVENYKLTAAQYGLINTYGVGVYSVDGDTLVEYTSFEEEWVSAVWYAGSIKVGNQYYTYANDSVKFNVLNITKGTVNDYAMIAGADYQAYLVYNKYHTDVVEIYIVVGDVIQFGTASAAATQVKDGGTYNYVVADGYITKANFVKDPEAPKYTVNGIGEYAEGSDVIVETLEGRYARVENADTHAVLGWIAIDEDGNAVVEDIACDVIVTDGYYEYTVDGVLCYTTVGTKSVYELATGSASGTLPGTGSLWTFGSFEDAYVANDQPAQLDVSLFTDVVIKTGYVTVTITDATGADLDEDNAAVAKVNSTYVLTNTGTDAVKVTVGTATPAVVNAGATYEIAIADADVAIEVTSPF